MPRILDWTQLLERTQENSKTYNTISHSVLVHEDDAAEPHQPDARQKVACQRTHLLGKRGGCVGQGGECCVRL
eukprot:2818632-Rhodomonas_salina.2